MCAKKNAYFEKLWYEVSENEQAIRAWDETRKAIAETTGWNEEALAKWDEKKPERTYTGGQIAALRAWRFAENKENYVELTDWFREDTTAQEFIDTLTAAGVKRFVVTDHSTALMETIHELVKAGCKMRGAKVIHTPGSYRAAGGDKWDETLGLLFVIRSKDEPADEPVVEEPVEEPKPEKKPRRRNKKSEEVAA